MRYAWAVVVFSFCTNLLLLTGPLYMMQVFDRVLMSGSVETLVGLSVSQTNITSDKSDADSACKTCKNHFTRRKREQQEQCEQLHVHVSNRPFEMLG